MYYRRMKNLRLLLCSSLILVACSSSTTGGTGGTVSLSTCDPLAPPATTLRTVLGAGQHPDGTTYVADPRVFLTQGGKLVRQHVVGSGESNNGDVTNYSLSFQPAESDGSDVRSLFLHLQGGAAEAMGVGPDDPKCSLSEGCPGSTPLTLVDPSTVAGLAIVNLPGQVEYVGDAANGDVIAMTAPLEYENGTDGFRIFLGPASGAREGVITDILYPGEGAPTITFTLDGGTYELAISTVHPAGGSPWGEPGPATLTRPDGSSVGVTLRLPTPTTLSGITALCR